MSRPATSPVVNRLPALLERRGMSWSELARRTLLPQPLLARLRAPRANPRLAVAERVAAALGVPVEELWTFPPGRGPR
jgi:transcriptional regulator with XRE-family HTH domain